jgi:iron complex transport system ATP-binding protein
MGRSPYTGFWGRLTKHDHAIVEESMRLTGTLTLRDRRVETLSDGERQKVMIAKSLAQETPLIFLDEPTAFLDFPSKVETMRLLKSLAKTNRKTVFQSTHDLNMALCLADRIWLVDKKIGVRIGTPTELAESGDLEKFFLREGISFNRGNISFLVDSF